VSGPKGSIDRATDRPPRRPLGSGGILVSPIGLGLAAIGRPAYITSGRDRDLGADRSVERLRGRTAALLDAAYAAGVRYVDAARSYGRAEEFLGGWLRSRGRSPDDVTVGSKWGYTYVGDWRLESGVQEVKDLKRATLRRQVGESRALLAPWLRIYQIHSATIESGVLDDTALLDDLARLRADDGLEIGLSVTGPSQASTVRRALQIRRDGRLLFGAVQATWNVLEPSAAAALAEAHEAGLGVIVKEVLANGRLAGRGNDAGEADNARHLVEVAGRGDRQRSADAIAIAAALAQPWADVVLSGAVTAEQLTSNLGALEVDLTADEDNRLALLSQPADAYWTARSERPWR